MASAIVVGWLTLAEAVLIDIYHPQKIWTY